MAEQHQISGSYSELNSYRISSLPASFYYIPSFLSPAEQSFILSKIPANRWTQLSKRRLQAHPSTLSASNILISSPLPDWLVRFPTVKERFETLGIFQDTKHKEPNHVLINEYNPGEGIMPHEDGAAYSPVVATISLGAAIVLDIYEKRSESTGSLDAEKLNGSVQSSQQSTPNFRILQEPGSLLVTTDEAYTDLLHGISPITRDDSLGPDTIANWELLGDMRRFELNGGSIDRTTRISLTYRDVLRVSKAGLGILGKR